jgi:hypothetical protein
MEGISIEFFSGARLHRRMSLTLHLTLTGEPNNDDTFGYDKQCAASWNQSVVNGNLNNDGSGRIVRKSGQFGEYL